MRIFVSLSAEQFSVTLREDAGMSTAQIREKIDAINKETKSNARITVMAKSIASVPKQFTITGTKRDVVFVAAGWYDTDPDEHQLSQDWNLDFVKS